ncbi:hypothetical protein FQN60_012776 [Etheostoma spectabile]|uniref:Sushi domain-containing protein n=1 Tax=Etheostoma spectabile TaxID=54343 RepID=A0A5J5DC22_9PERO|nr:hypothetical protein FQN60_012776 [Etheostoma spectabile]
MQLPLILLFLQLWGNVEVSLSQNVKPCVLPDDTPNGYYQIISGEEFVFGTTVQYFCNEGYHMVSKDDTRTCTLDKWTNHVPICEPLSCDPPPAVGGVIVKGLPDNDDPILPDRLLKFSCEGPGKYVNGSSVLRCGQDGQWNHPFPTCESCGTLPHIADADTKGTPKSWYSNGESVEYMCQNFYTMDGKPQQTCIDGKWTGQMRCLKPCTVDRELMNRYNLAFRYGYQDKLYSAHLDWIEFICTKGRRTGTLLMRQQCIDACSKLPDVPHAHLSKEFQEGELINFTCEPGYTTSSPTISYACSSEGWLTVNPGMCNKQHCGTPPHLADGDTKGTLKSQYTHGERVEYVCQNYYTMEGDPFQTCNNGEWTGQTRCLKPCTVDRELMNRHNIAFRYGYQDKLYIAHLDWIEFICTKGRRTGTLLMRPQCIDGVSLGCGSPPPLTDGDIKDTLKSIYSHQESVEFLCQSYYTMEGGPNRTCVDGEWIGQMRCLKPCTVDRELMNRHNIAFRNINSDKLYLVHNDFMEFTCTKGRNTGTLPMRQQCIDGEVNLPTCQ